MVFFFSHALLAAGKSGRISGHFPADAIARSQHHGRLASDTRVELSVTLKLKDEQGLQNLIERLHNPADPLYGHFLTPEQFSQTYSPTQQEYDEVVQYLADRGLTVVQTHPNRLVISVEGAASDIENAFQIELHQYVTPEGKVAHAPNQDPLLPENLSGRMNGIVGLSNFTPRVSHAHIRSAQPLTIGTGPNGGLAPSDIKKAYSMDTLPQTGAGETLALFELDGYNSSDIKSYMTKFAISPGPALQNILVDGASGTAGSGAIEVSLDLEMMIAIAPNASKILIYEGPNSDSGTIDTYSRIANDNLAREISTSWGGAEDQMLSSTMNSEKTIFMQMSAQGQSMFAASGDSGAYDDGSTLSVDDPGSQQYVVSVGGTTLTLGSAGSYASETTWSVPSPKPGSGSGGGISSQWTQPSWQNGLATSANLGSNSMRMVPDVSLNADPNTGYAVYSGGKWQVVGGTSACAPIWAAFTALVNQQRIASGSPALGYPNPALYGVAGSSTYVANFHDIADMSTNLHYPATGRYDLATGWGSMIGSALLSSLANPTLPPSVPTGLKLTPYNHVIAASWTASAGASSYTINRSNSSSGPFSILTQGLASTSFQDTGLQNGTIYYYFVQAVGPGGQSGNSTTVSASPMLVPPQTPTNFIVTGTGVSQ